MGRDARRTVLVLGQDVDLFAALRPELDSAMVHVTWATPDELAEAASSAVPWPWAIVGSGRELADEVHSSLRGLPVLWFWLGAAPASAPPGTRSHARWRSLLGDLQGCLDRRVAGVRLAPNRGLLAPGPSLVLSPELEGLLAGSPAGLSVSSRTVRAATRAVDRHRLPLVLTQDADRVALVGTA